jgi:hypothetical protein
VSVGGRASEEAVEVAVGGPGPHGAADYAEDDVEDRIRDRTAYGEAHEVEDDLYDLSRAGAEEPDDGPGNHGALRRVEELVVSPAAVDDLRRDGHEREGRDEVGDLVVERDRLEEAPQKAGRVQATQSRMSAITQVRGICRPPSVPPLSPRPP